MLLTTDQLSHFCQQVAMVDGSFDPIHDGHVGYFKAASEFAVPLLCNVAPDSWTVTKHPVFLEQQQRGAVLDSIRYISFVHLANVATIEVLRLLQPRYYIKGNDWVARGGVPKAEADVCEEFGIEVVYLPTVTNSSSKILKAWANQSEMKS